MRTCAVTNSRLTLVRPLGFSTASRHLKRAGLDYWEHLEVEVLDDWSSVEARVIAPTGRPPWLFTKTAERSYTSVAYQHGDVLVFGNESQGLPPSLLRQNSEQRLRIPIREQVRSLNLSNAVAIVAYEAQRQGVVSP